MDKEKLALFLGMLCGDGCLTLRNKKGGYYNYSIEFFNTDFDIVKNFANLFHELFGSEGRINYEFKENKKTLGVFRKYSQELYYVVSELGVPRGKKKDKLRVPEIIKKGNENEKFNFFIGYLITDGCLRKNKTILFHTGSKVFLEEFSQLIKELFGIDKKIKEYFQRNKYFSYQLNLNMKETKIALSKSGKIDLKEELEEIIPQILEHI